MSDLPTSRVPAIPIRTEFYFPGVQTPLSAGTNPAVQALVTAEQTHGHVLLIHPRDPRAPVPSPEGLPTVGTLARVEGARRGSGRWEGQATGVSRAWVWRWREDPLYLTADLRLLQSAGHSRPILHRLRAAMVRAIELDQAVPDEAAHRLARVRSLSLLTDIAAQNLHELERAERQRLLEIHDAVCRAAALIPRYEARAARLAGTPIPPPDPPRPAPQDDPGPRPEDPLRAVRWTAALLAACGDLPPVGVVELALDPVRDQDPATVDLARTLARQAAEDRRALENRWPLQTDFDRLDAAFTALDRAGILARHDWGLDAEDARRLLDRELARPRHADRTRGWAVYHHGQTRAAARGHGLELLFGGCADDPAAIGAEVVRTLRRHGLPACWAEDPAQPILLPIRWRRRMPPDPL